MSFEVFSVPILGPEVPSQVGENGKEKIKISVRWEWTTGIEREWKERKTGRREDGMIKKILIWYEWMGKVKVRCVL